MFKKAAIISAAAIAVMVFTGCSDEPDNKNSNQSTISVSSGDGELTVKEGSVSVGSQEEANALFIKLFDAASEGIEEGVNQSDIINGTSETTGGTTEIGQIRAANTETIAERVDGLSGFIDFSGKATFVESDTYENISAEAKATFYDFSADNSLYIGGSMALNLSLSATQESFTGYVKFATALSFSSDDFTGTLEFNAAAKISDAIEAGYEITSVSAKVDGYTIPQDIVNNKLNTLIETFETTSEPTGETIVING